MNWPSAGDAVTAPSAALTAGDWSGRAAAPLLPPVRRFCRRCSSLVSEAPGLERQSTGSGASRVSRARDELTIPGVSQRSWGES